MEQIGQETMQQQSYFNEQHQWYPQRDDSKRKNKSAIYYLGMVETVMGGLSILLSIVVVSIARREAYNNPYSYGVPPYGYNYICQGIWGGVLIVITGSLGILVKNRPTKTWYIVNMVMAIVTSNVALAVCIMSGIFAGVSYSRALQGLHAMVTLLCFVAFILMVIHAAFCCGGVCCKSQSEDTYNLVSGSQQTVVTSQQPQYIRGPNGQLFMVAQQQ